MGSEGAREILLLPAGTLTAGVTVGQCHFRKMKKKKKKEK